MMMKKLPLNLICILLSMSVYSQIDANSVIGLPTATTAEMNTIVPPNAATIGSVLFNTTDQEIYRYTTSGWVTSSDDQDASEVNSDTPVDVDGDGATEATVENVIQAIAPITAKAARIFYPPSIAINASVTGPPATPVDLYQEYRDQFSSPVAFSDATASTLPFYERNELYYYVTFADTNVFGNPTTITIDANGMMNYNIQNVPADFNSLINVVFVVK